MYVRAQNFKENLKYYTTKRRVYRCAKFGKRKFKSYTNRHGVYWRTKFENRKYKMTPLDMVYVCVQKCKTKSKMAPLDMVHVGVSFKNEKINRKEEMDGK